MQPDNSWAFKEWAVVCQALSEGRQIIILRKGGIVEEGGEFTLRSREFWLMPTFSHQSSDDLVPEARQDLESLAESAPETGTVEFRWYAEVALAEKISSFETLRALSGFHIWSESLVEERFTRWKDKGVTGLVVRVFKLPRPAVLPMEEEYAGCTSWVALKTPLPTRELKPVMPQERFEERLRSVRRALGT